MLFIVENFTPVSMKNLFKIPLLAQKIMSPVAQVAVLAFSLKKHNLQSADVFLVCDSRVVNRSLTFIDNRSDGQVVANRVYICRRRCIDRINHFLRRKYELEARKGHLKHRRLHIHPRICELLHKPVAHIKRLLAEHAEIYGINVGVQSSSAEVFHSLTTLFALEVSLRLPCRSINAFFTRALN